MSAYQEQTLSGGGARVYTAHRGWLGVVTGISAASTGAVLVQISSAAGPEEPGQHMNFFLCTKPIKNSDFTDV